jgi:hypothetical protein
LAIDSGKEEFQRLLLYFGYLLEPIVEIWPLSFLKIQNMANKCCFFPQNPLKLVYIEIIWGGGDFQPPKTTQRVLLRISLNKIKWMQ